MFATLTISKCVPRVYVKNTFFYCKFVVGVGKEPRLLIFSRTFACDTLALTSFII